MLTVFLLPAVEVPLLHRQNPRLKTSSPGPVTHIGLAASDSLKSTAAVPWTTRATKKHPIHQSEHLCYFTCTLHSQFKIAPQRDYSGYETAINCFNELNLSFSSRGSVFECFYMKEKTNKQINNFAVSYNSRTTVLVLKRWAKLLTISQTGNYFFLRVLCHRTLINNGKPYQKMWPGLI